MEACWNLGQNLETELKRLTHMHIPTHACIHTHTAPTNKKELKGHLII